MKIVPLSHTEILLVGINPNIITKGKYKDLVKKFLQRLVYKRQTMKGW